MLDDSNSPEPRPAAAPAGGEPDEHEVSPRDLRRFRGPALAAGGVALVSPLGIGFAVGVAAVAAGMFFWSRRSARSAGKEGRG